MRVRTISLVLIFIGSIASPLIPITSAALEDLGPAGEVYEFDLPILDWWVLDNGNVLVATVDGYVVEYVSLANGSYAVVWSEFTNQTLYSGALNIDEGLLAVGSINGVTVISLDYMEELYRFTLGQQVDAITWDAEGDIWATQRISKKAIEWNTETNSQSGISTTPHNNGITGVESLSSGHILTSGRDKQILIHDGSGSFIQSMSESQSPLLRLGVSNDETKIFSTTDNCGLEVYNTSSWSRVSSLNLCSNGQGRSIQQLGNRLMLGMSNGNVFSVDITNESIIQGQEFSVQGEVVGFRNAAGSGVYVLTTFSTTSEIHLLDTDRDGDGTVDGLDVFPDDATQSSDFDGDGYGDNSDGNNSDAFPSDSTQWSDVDGDGFGDNPTGNNPDAFPQNPSQNTDSDGDGYGDNRYADQGDKFIDDSTQWADADGDGYGDNQELGATSPDACPNQSGESTLDRLGCQDTDGDGWSDPGNGDNAHPSGNADAFPMQVNQWRDTDGDGYGDNLSGFRGDACPTLAGTSTRAIIFEPSENEFNTINRYGCTDTDSDGYDDTTESSTDGCTMVGNQTEWLDHDRDCTGSNGDYNDTDPEVQTFADHCAKHPDSQEKCVDTTDNDFDNLTIYEEEKSTEVMALVKEFAVFAGYIVIAMAIALVLIVGTLRVVGKARDKRKPDAQYTHQDATRELDAWESGENFETRGGIDEQKAWGEENLEGSKESMDVDIPEESIIEPDEEYEPGEMSIPAEEKSTDEEVQVEESESPEQPPAEMAPLPSGGLPEGWTMEQWRWYGHQWLEKHGQK